MKKSFAVLFSLGFMLFACGNKVTAQCCDANISGEVKEETNEKAKEEVKIPTLVDLGAKKCIPCKMMAPILDDLTKEYAGILTVKFIDVWEKEGAAEAEKYKIKSIPTQIFFDEKGKELWRHEGFISKDDILKKWKELGYSLSKPKNEKTEKKQ